MYIIASNCTMSESVQSTLNWGKPWTERYLYFVNVLRLSCTIRSIGALRRLVLTTLSVPLWSILENKCQEVLQIVDDLRIYRFYMKITKRGGGDMTNLKNAQQDMKLKLKCLENKEIPFVKQKKNAYFFLNSWPKNYDSLQI